LNLDKIAFVYLVIPQFSQVLKCILPHGVFLTYNTPTVGHLKIANLQPERKQHLLFLRKLARKARRVEVESICKTEMLPR
jgi:hypothetical protein